VREQKIIGGTTTTRPRSLFKKIRRSEKKKSVKRQFLLLSTNANFNDEKQIPNDIAKRNPAIMKEDFNR